MLKSRWRGWRMAMNIRNSPVAYSDKNRQKKNHKGSVPLTVSIRWRFYFWFHGEK